MKDSGQKRVSSTYNAAADVTMGITPEDKSKKLEKQNEKSKAKKQEAKKRK